MHGIKYNKSAFLLLFYFINISRIIVCFLQRKSTGILFSEDFLSNETFYALKVENLIL